MRKLEFLALPAVAVLALLATACNGGDTIVQPASQGTSGVSATGTGRAVGEPDIAVVSVGVNVQRESVEEAREVAATAQEDVIQSLLDNGVAEEDIQTVQFSVNPQYGDRPAQDGGSEIVGYVVSNVVTAKVRDLDVTSQAIDDATRAGGNDAVVQGVSFTVDDPTELRAEARTQAVDMAKTQAEELASAAGEQLGELVSISEDGGFIPFERAFDAAASIGGLQQAETPIEPGQVEVTINVNMVFALE